MGGGFARGEKRTKNNSKHTNTTKDESQRTKHSSPPPPSEILSTENCPKFARLEKRGMCVCVCVCVISSHLSAASVLGSPQTAGVGWSLLTSSSLRLPPAPPPTTRAVTDCLRCMTSLSLMTDTGPQRTSLTLPESDIERRVDLIASEVIVFSALSFWLRRSSASRACGGGEEK